MKFFKQSLFIGLLLLFCRTISFSQGMSKDKLKLIVAKNSTILQEGASSLHFKFKETEMYLIFDEKGNRMRIMTPVVEEKNLKKNDYIKLLQANYHTALDAKYTIDDGYVWSVYMHPLKELSEPQILDAMYQVRNLMITYGTYYSSSNLTF